MYLSLPENCKIVEAITPQTGASARTGDYVSLKNVVKAWVVVHFNMAGAGNATYATMYEATATSGAGAAATTGNAYDIWSIASTTADTLTHQTSGYRYATTTDATGQVIIFGIKPSQLTATYDCIQVRVASSSTATNFVSAMYYLQTAYPADQPPSAISN